MWKITNNTTPSIEIPTMAKTLKTIRVLLALIFFIGITFLFVDFRTSTGHWWDWFKYSQLIPAIFSASAISIIILFVITLIFGRIYCSSVCPLGILQDIIGRICGLFMKKSRRKSRFEYSRGFPVLRYIVFVLFFVAMVIGIYYAGVRTWASLVEPYSAYGRIATTVFGPAWDLGNNILADLSVQKDNTMFWHLGPQTFSWLTLTIALVTLLILVLCVAFGGRLWCNTLCPAGTLLGLVSRYSLLAPVINKSRCVSCRKCERDCKAQCIDIKNKYIDYSRCVTCYNCLGDCKFSALSYTWRTRASQYAKSEEKTAQK